MKSPWVMLRTSVLFVGIVLFPSSMLAQGGAVRARVTEPVDTENPVTLPGNVHPLARAEFDQGAAPDDLPMERMLLVLQRSSAQESALRQLLNDQQMKSSPRFHHWLTPEQFGRQFGPADSDVQAVTDWLTSQGFAVNRVSAGRTVIEFSGTAGLVRQVLETEIHRFRVNGQDHWANTSDPQIPAALATVVAGFASLNNFPRQPVNRNVRAVPRPRTAGEGRALYTFPMSGYDYYLVGPTDFATIYNVLPLWNGGVDGTGQTIAVVSDSNIHLSDAETFRSFFSLPARDPQIILNGTDPGVNDDEVEANIDVEWSGAVAKNATIDLVISPTTNSTWGIDLSALYIVDNNLAPIMSVSYGECEQFLGAGGNAFEFANREQGAAEGITILNSTNDYGSALCDQSENEVAAEYGLAVSGLASTPFDVAVGGTDFADLYGWSDYWNPANTSPGLASARSYIPETVWNSSCAAYGALSDCASAGNDTPQGIDLRAGSGGPSSCGLWTGSSASCAGGYPKPGWQTGVGVPNDGVRDTPDVSLFASSGTNYSFYAFCQADILAAGEDPCSPSGENAYYEYCWGTSVGAQAFAGIMALVDQQTGQRQGNANYILYPMAALPGATCTSNPPTVSNSQCIFYDVVTGNNSVACVAGTLNCSVQSGGGYGVLVDPADNSTPAWSATPGYDMATGLGSVNAANLVNRWAAVSVPEFSLAAKPPSIDIPAPGESGNATITVSPVNGFVGMVSLSVTSGCPSGATCTVSSPVTISGTSPATSTLTVITSGSSSTATVAHIRTPPSYRFPAGIVWMLSGFTALAALAGATAVRRRPAALLYLTALLVVGGWAACGGGGGGGSSPATATPAVSLSLLNLTFSSQQVGTASPPQSVTLTNAGNAMLSIAAVDLTGTNSADFSQTNSCGGSVEPGSNCTVNVEFKPAAGGMRSAAVSIADNANGSPQTINLSGTGVAVISPGTYPVEINAVTSNDSHSLTVNVTVQ